MDAGRVGFYVAKDLGPVPGGVGRHDQAVHLGGRQPGLDFQVGLARLGEKFLPVPPAGMAAPTNSLRYFRRRVDASTNPLPCPSSAASQGISTPSHWKKNSLAKVELSE